MYTDKKNILQLTALLKAHGIKKFVLCPGSRNIPLVQTFANVPEFVCYSMTDERSAGFFALGMALHSGEPVAVCCTSGTAVLNLSPAVAEAYYQKIPLLVISADRPAAWIGQMDGQTLPQPNIFGNLTKKSVHLPEPYTEEDAWYCNRLINEALLALKHHGKGPVHINVPISEPFFLLPVEKLPEERVIERYEGLNMYQKDYTSLITRLNTYKKKMVVAGQMSLIYLYDKKYVKPLSKHFTWFTESISNRIVPHTSIKNVDTLLCKLNANKLSEMKPDLLITYGGHIISKRLKAFLRKHKPQEHWHICEDGEVVDLYGTLTTVIEMNPFEFFEKIAPMLSMTADAYPQVWDTLSKDVNKVLFPYSAMYAIGKVIENLPENVSLHLANSSAVRYAQFFSVSEQVEVLSNRGTNGIEGSLSTAIGYATVSDKLNFIIIGDLSFFYDMNALWNNNYGSNIRILLLNNDGGEIFKALPGLQLSKEGERFVLAPHHTSARAWAEDRGFTYLCAKNEAEIEAHLPTFLDPSITPKPILLEVFTDKEQDIQALKEYFHQIKK